MSSMLHTPGEQLKSPQKATERGPSAESRKHSPRRTIPRQPLRTRRGRDICLREGSVSFSLLSLGGADKEKRGLLDQRQEVAPDSCAYIAASIYL